MLQRCSEQVKSLLGKAADARERAMQSVAPEDREFWLAMEARWLSLAGNAEQVERTDDLLAEAARR